MAFGRLGTGEIILILIIALIIFGPKRLPELAKAIGKSVKEFKRTMSGESSPDEKKTKAKKK